MKQTNEIKMNKFSLMQKYIKRLLSNDKQIVYFDFDSVVFNLVPSGLSLYQRNQYHDALNNCPGYYSHGVPKPNIVHSYVAISQYYDTFMISQTHELNPGAYQDKQLFLSQFFGNYCNKRLIFSPDYSVQYGHYLITDVHYSGNFRGEIIKLGSERFPDFESIVNYLVGMEKR